MRDRGEQLHHDLDNHLIQGGYRGDLSIDGEALKKAFNRFEQLDKHIIARLDRPGRLIRSDVTTICRWELKNGTHSK